MVQLHTQLQPQRWSICAWRLVGMQLLLLTSRTFGQLEQYYQAGTVVGGMASPTGRPYYACPPGFLRMANSCYRLSTSAATWREAHFQCRDLGAQLAAFERPWEDKTIRRFLNNANLPGHERWIGASYDSQSHRWMWAAQAKATTFKSFPRRFVSQDWSWHCLALDPLSRYHWRPRPCIKKNYFLCEVPLHCVVGPNDGLAANGTAFITGHRWGRLDTSERKRPNCRCGVRGIRHRSRRPGSGRHHGTSSERPGRLGESQRPRVAENEEEGPPGRGARRRDKDRSGRKRGRQRNRIPDNIEYQSYRHFALHPPPQRVYAEETTYPRNRPDHRRPSDRKSGFSAKTTQHISNEIPIYPLAEMPVVDG